MDTAIEKVIFLQKVELFEDVPSEQLAYLAGITERVSCDEGDVLFSEGDPSQSLFLLVDGRVELEREGRKREEVSEPTAIGVWGFFDDQPRLMTARVLEDSCLLRINNVDFFDLLEERVHLSRGLLKYFVRRIRKLIEATDMVV